jgi:hypothetical protein
MVEFGKNQGGNMKKILSSILLLSSFASFGMASTSKVATGTVLNTPQVRIELGRRRRHRHRDWAMGERIGYGRTVTRIVQRGWRRYQETYRVRYLPNGQTQWFLVSRVRLN